MVIPQHFCKKIRICIKIVSVTPYDVNGGKHPKTHPLFFLFSGDYNLRCLQATYLKFAEYVHIGIMYVDILVYVQNIYKKN